jgi:hypothetical protein
VALRIGLNITGVPEDVLPEAAQLDAASTDPGRRPASGACHAFPRDTDAARLHQPTDSISRLPFISLLPPTRRHRLPFRWRRHRQRHPGAGPPWQPKCRRTTRSIFDCDTTSTRRVHHRDRRRGHLYPHCLPVDVSVHLGMLAKWVGLFVNAKQRCPVGCKAIVSHRGNRARLETVIRSTVIIDPERSRIIGPTVRAAGLRPREAEELCAAA